MWLFRGGNVITSRANISTSVPNFISVSNQGVTNIGVTKLGVTYIGVTNMSYGNDYMETTHFKKGLP